MDIILTALKSIWDMLNEMSPYLLLGFLLAGLMHSFIPGAIFSKYLSGRSFRSVANAALFGVPLPLCSCGVIPTAMSLRREGASKGAAVSFLIATPQTGVDSILATYSLLGLPFAILRPIVAFVTALFGGQMVNLVEGLTPQPPLLEARGSKKSSSNQETNNFIYKIKEALKYGFGEMMEDIGKWLAIGIVVAGLISLIPDDFFAIFKDNSFLSILLVLAISIPMYLCATGSIPIAVALMLKGLTPGAALVLLMAGPASNMASIMVIGKVLGRRTLATYLASIISGAIVFALLIDLVLPSSWFIPMMMTGDCCNDETSWFSIACSLLLCCLLLKALLFHHHHHHDHDHCCCEEEHEEGETCDVLTIHIDGMHCSHCAAAAKKAIESVPGVEGAEVDLDSKSATIKGHFDKLSTGQADAEAIKAAVEAVGYKVKV